MSFTELNVLGTTMYLLCKLVLAIERDFFLPKFDHSIQALILNVIFVLKISSRPLQINFVAAYKSKTLQSILQNANPFF